MVRGVWWATVHRVAQSRTRLSDWAHIHSLYKSNVKCGPWTGASFHLLLLLLLSRFSCVRLCATPISPELMRNADCLASTVLKSGAQESLVWPALSVITRGGSFRSIVLRNTSISSWRLGNGALMLWASSTAANNSSYFKKMIQLCFIRQICKNNICSGSKSCFLV